MNDWKLIRQYVDGGSEGAFGDLARRYTNLVYATCLRELRSPSLAEDATQAVFIVLSLKAHTFRSRKMLTSWLFQTALLTSKNMLRRENRRLQGEQEYTQEQVRTATERSAWRDAEPALNEALLALAAAGREMILRRFYEQESFAAIGAALGLKEDAVRMRVNRALERMRRAFERDGVSISAAVIAGALGSALSHKPAQYATAPVDLERDNRTTFATLGIGASWGSVTGGSMPEVALGLPYHGSVSESVPQYSLSAPDVIDGVPVDVVIARQYDTRGLDGPQVLTWYIGRRDHLLYKFTGAY